MCGKVRGQHRQLPQAQDGLVVIPGPRTAGEGDKAVADVQDTLGCDLQVAFRNVPEVGVGVKLSLASALERL